MPFAKVTESGESEEDEGHRYVRQMQRRKARAGASCKSRPRDLDKQLILGESIWVRYELEEPIESYIVEAQVNH